MVDDSQPFPHLSNILHQLGHELHSELTEDICRRNAARIFENKLEIPINRAKLEKASIGASTFPYYSKLAPQCGDCALITMKKPIERLRGPPPPRHSTSLSLRKSKSSEVQIVKRKKSMISVITNNQKFHQHHSNDINDNGKQRRRRQHYRRIQKVPKMCDSSTQTDNSILDGKKKKKEEMDGRIDLIKNDKIDDVEDGSGVQIDESFTVTETASDTMFGKYERKLDGKRQWKHRKIGNNPKKLAKKEEKSVKIVSTKEVPKEIVKKQEKPQKKARKCSIPAAEDAIPRIPREQQLYAPIELHCATESAVKAVDRTVNALEKLVLLAPANSIEKSLMKTISLMCVFLRQFHTELRTRKDRRSKLEIILKLWTELQKHATKEKAVIIPSEVYQQPSSASTTVLQPPPPSMPADDVTVKNNTVSPTTSSASNIFEQKKKQQKSKLS